MKSKAFLKGVQDGMPIALGYFVVSFSLGIAAKKAGLTSLQGFIASVSTVASAGEYAGILVILDSAPYIEMFLAILISNARYFLMSCALSQRINPKTGMGHRLLMGYGLTDEIFGIAIAREGYVEPAYNYGAMAIAIPFWGIGTSLGIIMGNILPLRIVSTLSVSLYAMFIAIIIAPAKKDKVIAALIIISFASSFAFARLPLLSGISSGSKTIILTLVISALAAIICPVKEKENAK